MKAINSILTASVILVLFILISCQKEDIQKNVPIRTIIAYIAADNDLVYDASISLQQMEQGFSETGVNLIVFNCFQNDCK